MAPISIYLHLQHWICLILLTFFCNSCKNDSQAVTAFYYWKSNFQLHHAQETLLNKAASNTLYLRFFDIKWDGKNRQPYPEALVSFKTSTTGINITPVIFITNQTFEKLSKKGINSLAIKSNMLIEHLAAQQNISYQTIQVDCDWTVNTKDSYFRFLKSLAALSRKPLGATIRLHQVKYQFKTGVPPVSRGILMFYNMGKLTADTKDPNSIYNLQEAKKYVNSLPTYLLPLDMALPVFSWSLQIRSGKIIQVYSKIGRAELSNMQNFVPANQKNVYRAIKSFFMSGVYVKTDDLFKLEETDKKLLEQAALQLSAHVNKKEIRTIIYYELSNLDLSSFKAADFKTISAYF